MSPWHGGEGCTLPLRPGKHTAGPRQVGNPLVPGIWAELEIPAPRCGRFSLFLENSTPQQLCTDAGLPSVRGLAQNLCLGLESRPEWGSRPPVLSTLGRLVILPTSGLDFSRRHFKVSTSHLPSLGLCFLTYDMKGLIYPFLF